MSEKLYHALEVCLLAIENGETPDAALARFPQFEAELRPLLHASLQARTLAASAIPSEAQRRGRTRLLQHAAEMREAKRAPKRTWLYQFRPLAIALILLAFFFTGTNLVRASSTALPGDGLYPVKRTWEGVQLLFVFFDEVKREGLELEHENERLHEINELLAKGREEPVTFSGYVTAQNGDLWTVAGVPVRISSQTRLPQNAVQTGAGIRVTGRTDAQGFLIAQRVEVLPPGTVIPPIEEEGSEEEHEEEEENEENEESEPSFLASQTPAPFSTATVVGTGTPTPAGTISVTATETNTEKQEEEEQREEEGEKEEEKEEEEDND